MLPSTTERIGGITQNASSSHQHTIDFVCSPRLKCVMIPSTILQMVIIFAFMTIRNIFCLRKERENPTGAYYRIFEVYISTYELVKCNATTHMELHKDYANGDNEDETNRV